jgi:hypothetical protein
MTIHKSIKVDRLPPLLTAMRGADKVKVRFLADGLGTRVALHRGWDQGPKMLRASKGYFHGWDSF